MGFPFDRRESSGRCSYPHARKLAACLRRAHELCPALSGLLQLRPNVALPRFSTSNHRGFRTLVSTRRSVDPCTKQVSAALRETRKGGTASITGSSPIA